MKTAFTIYVRAIGIYCLVTLPIIMLPIMYFNSLFYVAIYGWFAWGLFTTIYLLTDYFRLNFPSRMLVLVIGTVLSVAFAYQVMEILHVEDDVWHSEFIWFPAGAVIAGWVSLFTLYEKVKADCPGYTEIADDSTGEESIF
ncbi:MAG TPA: hypothetical protein VGO58_06835 [Chitinophagaceae bacterium]|jgi:hypothetical protein|nr:hypothetical protein [Chitinophagaceae bacterium]